MAPADWVGLYADTLPCADCPGILTQLDLRPDSLFILRERYLERDSIPFGHIGTWRIANGELLLAMGNGATQPWKSLSDGLERLGVSGKFVNSTLPLAIQRVKNIEPSPVRITGAYLFNGGSHSFRPCGSNYAFPVAMDAPAEAGRELERSYSKKVAHGGDPLFAELVVSMRIGPAMEGDGTEEYLHIDRLLRVLDVQQCP
jgi:copper homeostasis protein (lipoprotein)